MNNKLTIPNIVDFTLNNFERSISLDGEGNIIYIYLSETKDKLGNYFVFNEATQVVRLYKNGSCVEEMRIYKTNDYDGRQYYKNVIGEFLKFITVHIQEYDNFVKDTMRESLSSIDFNTLYK